MVRLSHEGEIDVWSLHSQTLLASTRWPAEVATVCGLRRSPFVLVGQEDGTLRVAAVQAGAGGGELVPRSYRVSASRAMGQSHGGDVGDGSLSLDGGRQLSATPPIGGRGGESDGARSALVAIAPQPGAESGRVLLAYADGGMSLWDFHARRPVAVNGSRGGGAGAMAVVGELRGASWVGGSGAVAVSGHEGGLVVIWSVPPPGLGTTPPLYIVPLHTLRPQAPLHRLITGAHALTGAAAGEDDDVPSVASDAAQNDELMPVRGVLALAVGGPTAPFHRLGGGDKEPGVGGVLMIIGKLFTQHPKSQSLNLAAA